nr:LacI family DNA-binding transcriptional regulator [Bifidobacterium tibiigranuli]
MPRGRSVTQHKTTVQDIARHCQVSTATVSRALNDRPGVSPQIKSRVLKYVKSIGYVPNSTARSMRTGMSSLAVLVIQIQSSDRQAVIPSQAFELVSRLGLELRVVHIPYGEDFVDGLLKAEADCHPAIFLLFGLCDIGDKSRLSKVQAPIMFILSDDAPTEYPHVASDDEDGAYAITESLIAAGHHSIMVLSELKSNGEPYYQRRITGFRNALVAHHMVFDSSQVQALHVDYNNHADSFMAAFREQIPPLLAKPDRPTAIFILDDYLTVFVTKMLSEADIRIPDDISLASFGGWEVTSFLPAPIQSWVPPIPYILETSTAAGLSTLQGKPFSGEISLPPLDASDGPGASDAPSPKQVSASAKPAVARAISPTCFMVPGYLRIGQSVRNLNA